MKYIECIHCRKRFAANEKHMAAFGKKVRCACCGKSFPIVVYEVKPEKVFVIASKSEAS